MKASIIIRTKNEAKLLSKVLEKLALQTEKDFEVVIVDSGSSDCTLSIAKSFQNRLNLSIYQIPATSFTYPYACNYGAGRAKGEYLVYISGHSIPLNNSWLYSGLSNFKDKNVAGVYGNVRPSADATFVEWLYYFPGFITGKKIINKRGMGILANTNSIIRRELWEKHHFDENYADGGEDGEWAYYFISEGYRIIKDPQFTVYHSHHLGLLGLIRQYRHWCKVADKFARQYHVK